MCSEHACKVKHYFRVITMPDSYPIVTVRPEWVLYPEGMGSKTKFWYKNPEEEQRWLFKYSQPGTGQHWAEKIAERAAHHLQILHAKVELAQFQGQYGSVTESFAHQGRELYHGNQMLEQLVQNYDPEKKFNQSDHTMENIFSAMDEIFLSSEATELAKACISGYLVLDALIGNTDRHHENWGILRWCTGDDLKGWVAPSFDHASSLGRELLDERRDRILAEGRVGAYAEKGRGAVYWSGDEPHGPSPLALVRQAVEHQPNTFWPTLKNLPFLSEAIIINLVDRVPSDMMTPSARKFTIALIRYNLEQLMKLAEEYENPLLRLA